MLDTADNIWRDHVTYGVPSSGANAPLKREIREWGTSVETSIYASTTGRFGYGTRADLYADLSHVQYTMAWVLTDPTAAYNGIYIKTGASGSGSWMRFRDLPDSYIRASNAGGFFNIAATTSTPVPAADGGALIALPIAETNVISPITVSFNGGSALTIKTSSGNDVAIGGLVEGMVVAGYVSGSTFRLLTDQASAAIQAAAEAAQGYAEEWANKAEGSPVSVGAGGDGSTEFSAKHWAAKAEEFAGQVTGIIPVTTRTALKAIDTTAITTAILVEGVPRTSGRFGVFKWQTGNFSSRITADTQEGIYIKADAIASSAGAWVRQYDGPVNVMWFGASRDNSGVDSHAAIQGAIDLIEATEPQAALRYGTKLYFPAGQYEVSEQVLISEAGIRPVGDGPVTTVIKAQSGFTGDAVVKISPANTTDTISGAGLIEIGIDCNLQACHGFMGESLYDNILFDDVRISNIAADKNSFRVQKKSGHSLPVCQTISIRKLFAAKYNATAGVGTVPGVYLANCQEILIEESKAWNSNLGDGSGTQPAWYIEDCRSLWMIGISAANANVGIQVHSTTRTCDTIVIESPLYENVDYPLVVSGTLNTDNLRHTNPRHQNAASSGYDLSMVRGGYIEVKSATATLGADSETSHVVCDAVSQVTDNGTANMITASRNLVTDQQQFGHNLSVKPAGTEVFRTATPVSDLLTGVYLAAHIGGSVVLRNVYVGGANSGGTGFRFLRVDN